MAQRKANKGDIMNKEEQLIQEAVEYVSNYEGYGWTPHEGSPVFYAMVYSYIAGAESREKANRKTEKEKE